MLGEFCRIAFSRQLKAPKADELRRNGRRSTRKSLTRHWHNEAKALVARRNLRTETKANSWLLNLIYAHICTTGYAAVCRGQFWSLTEGWMLKRNRLFVYIRKTKNFLGREQLLPQAFSLVKKETPFHIPPLKCPLHPDSGHATDA